MGGHGETSDLWWRWCADAGRRGLKRAGARREGWAPAIGAWGTSTEWMTWMTPFEAEMSVAMIPAESSWLRVRVSPRSTR
ncbi:MAG TPA: hypothetical protein VE011_07525 [Candidatus Dormibacteraeota bacterium]|nr:hypothetical protein [Candidatus Dormibacteraeota bacterium]